MTSNRHANGMFFIFQKILQGIFEPPGGLSLLALPCLSHVSCGGSCLPDAISDAMLDALLAVVACLLLMVDFVARNQAILAIFAFFAVR